MKIRLAAIADDYTGASDLANTWRKEGLNTIQSIGVPPPGLAETQELDCIVVALKIRSVPAAEAVEAALEALGRLREFGAEHVLYKICSTFDSTDEGNIGPVSDALRSATGAAWTLMTPAFPETGRTVYKGHLFVGEQLLHESPLKDHPLNPMRDSALPRLLAAQTASRIGRLDIETVRAGAAACLRQIEALAAAGGASIIADALSEADLEALGEAALRSPVSTGASGLGLGLARSVRKAAGVAAVTRQEPAVGGLSAVIVGSCSERTLQQVAAAERVMPVLRLDPEALIESGGDISEATAFAERHLPKGPALFCASAPPQVVARIQARFGSQNAGRAIEHALAELAAELVAYGVRKLIVAGGETSGTVVDRLGIKLLSIGPELAAGVPVVRTVDRPDGDMLLALKSGNFGGIDFFQHALSRLAIRF